MQRGKDFIWKYQNDDACGVKEKVVKKKKKPNKQQTNNKLEHLVSHLTRVS